MARKGEKIVNATEFETRLRALENKIKSAAGSFYVLDNSAGAKNNVMIIKFRQSIAGGGTAVTFITAFKTGTVPVVVGSSENVDANFSMNAAATATGFTAYSTKHDGTALTSDCDWIAIGERS
jgi:hypothetical protein